MSLLRDKRRVLYPLIWIFLLWTGTGLLISGCNQPQDERYGGTLRWGLLAAPTNLDPLTSRLLWDNTAIYLIFEGLVKYANRSLTIIPSLAESWIQSDDGLTWTFKLKDGITFHDGTPFNAEAVVFHFDRLLNKDHPYHPKHYSISMFYQLIKKVEAPSPSTITFTLERPYRLFLDRLAWSHSLILSPTSVKKNFSENSFHPVGTGAFKLDEHVPGKKCSLTSNTNYHEGKSYLDRVEFYSWGHFSGNVLLEILSGSLDGIYFPGIPEAGLRRNPKIKIISKIGLDTNFYVLNTTRPPLNDVRVRKALRYAYRQTAIHNFDDSQQKTGIPAYNIVSPSFFKKGYHYKNQYPYNPEKAKELLRQAGYPNGFKLTLLESRDYYYVATTHSTFFLQNMLKRIGIQVDLEHIADPQEFWQRIKDDEFDIFFTQSFPTHGDIITFLFGVLGAHGDTTSIQSICNDETVHSLFLEFLFTQRTSDETQKILMIIDRIDDLTPLIPYDYVTNRAVLSERVHNFVLHPIAARYDFSKIWKSKK